MNSIKTRKGFFLMETLVALALVAIAAAGMGRVLHHTLHSSKSSSMRLKYQVHSSSWRDRLLSVSFQHPWIQKGSHRHQEGKLLFSWRVEIESPQLRRISLTVSEGEWKTNCRFIKSRYLHNGVDSSDKTPVESGGGDA